MHGLLAALCLVLGLGLVGAAAAQGVELRSLEAVREDGALLLDFSVRPVLTRAVEDALQRGVPIHFVAEATVFRSRWYWRDSRAARASRGWRLSYQPLTSAWRVSTGGLSQSFDSLEGALSAVSRAARWRIAEAAQIDPDSRHYVEFAWRLDTTQLPRPMQIGLLGQAGWELAVEQTLKVEP